MWDMRHGTCLTIICYILIMLKSVTRLNFHVCLRVMALCTNVEEINVIQSKCIFLKACVLLVGVQVLADSDYMCSVEAQSLNVHIQ